MLTLRLFGSLEIISEDRPLPKMRSQTGRWLLALLILRRSTSLDRPSLAAMLWPDSDEERASFYLRRTLSELRQALGDEAERLQSPTARSLRFDLTNVDCDVVRFETALQNRDYATAISLYRGPLLESCGEEWAIGLRAHYEEQFLVALTRVSEEAEAKGDLAGAIRYLRLIVRTDPTRETAQQNLMRLLGMSGDTAAGLQVYRNFKLFLMREGLGTPSAETEAIHQAIRQGTYQHRLTATKGISFTSASVLPSPPINTPPINTPVNHLPIPLTGLVGREAELSEVSGYLQSNRLVTITGNGGAGKTRLAIAVAQASATLFPQGVHFVDLSALNSPDLIAQAVAQTLEIPIAAGTSPLYTLQKAISSHNTLIIIDNCEHLLEETSHLVGTILSTCPHVRLLATSRQSLGVMGEKVYRLPPLSNTAAITLFLERALSSAPQGAMQSDIGRVCQLLEGVPLAIELAAAWTAYLPLTDIEANLHDRLFSPSGNRSLPPRHRTLRATLDWGFNLLTVEEQGLFTRLSVFAGSWTWEAAKTVVNASPYLLGALVDKSLVVFSGERYSFQETVRQYATERLAEEEKPILFSALQQWCIKIAEEASPHLSGKDSTEYLSWLDGERDNLRAGLDWSRTNQQQEGLRIALALAPYWKIRGYVKEGLHYFYSLLKREGEDTLRPHAAALEQVAILETQMGNYAQADALLMEATAIYEAQNNRRARADILRHRGNLAHHRSQYDLARSLFGEALPLYQEIGDRQGEAQCLENLGYLARQQGNYEQSAKLLLQVITLHQETGNAMGEVSAIGSLAYTRLFQGKLATAASLFEKALTIHHTTGNRGGIGWNLAGLAEATMVAGDLARAKVLLLESLAIHQEIGSRGSEAWNRSHLGNLARRMGNREEARNHFQEAEMIYRAIDNKTEAERMEKEKNSITLPVAAD